MGFKRNAADKTSGPAPGGAVNDTPTHTSIWDGSNINTANWIADLPLLDDSTGNTPIFDIALGDTLQFDVNDFVVEQPVSASQGEALAEDLLGGLPTYYAFFHTTAPGANHTDNVITGIPGLALDDLTYAAT